VILLDQGRVICEGPPMELLSNAALMDTHGLEVPYSLRNKSG
jgi:cobalt/nickel transport system ATP-binding protein